MPNAVNARALGNVFRLHACDVSTCLPVPTVRAAAAHPDISCGRCLQKPPPWQRLIAVSDYVPPLSGLTHQLKFSRRSEIAPALSRLMLLEVLQARRTRGLPFPNRLISVRSGNADTGAGDLTKVTYCAARWRTG